MDELDLLREFRSQTDMSDTCGAERAHGRLLAEIDARPGRRRLALRKPAAAALIASPAIAALAVLAFAGSLGGNATSLAAAAILHRADDALSGPVNEILHTKVVGGGFGAESWQLTSAPYSFLGTKGPLNGAAGEGADNGGTSSFYDPSSNTIYQAPSGPANTSGGAPARTPARRRGDPISMVRAELHNGGAQMLGSTTTDGVPTYEIRFASKGGFGRDSLIAYVDRQTYRPVLLSDPQSNGTVVQLRVVTFEYLPATPANMQLLSLTARHPGARVVVQGSSKPLPGGK
jgi:hypothetical protein